MAVLFRRIALRIKGNRNVAISETLLAVAGIIPHTSFVSGCHMPSRFGIFSIVLFWIATTGLVAYRDFLPRLFASGPPPISIDLADEAGQFVPVRWLILRDGKKIGSLTTEMKYIGTDDTFRYTHTYKEVTLDFAGVQVTLPEVTETTRVTRTGELRAQWLDGRILVGYRKGTIGFDIAARANLHARVENGMLVGHVEVTAPGMTAFERPLEPVPVGDGRVLNPLQPVNRLARVRGGLQWQVPQVNPLRDAVAAMAKSSGFALGEPRVGDLIANVANEPQILHFKGEDVPCWVIEYRTAEPVARTWVKVADGKVLRQEAFDRGEHVALERDD